MEAMDGDLGAGGRMGAERYQWDEHSQPGDNEFSSQTGIKRASTRYGSQQTQKSHLISRRVITGGHVPLLSLRGFPVTTHAMYFLLLFEE